jgi:saccharopine dehydrogenase-like NADP-dependent oxidoreductase
MKDILVIGGGKIGSVVAALLVNTPEANGYRVTVADRSATLLA